MQGSLYFLLYPEDSHMKNQRISKIVTAQKEYLNNLNSNIEFILRNSPDGRLNLHKKGSDYRFELKAGDNFKPAYISRGAANFKEYAAKYCAMALGPVVGKSLQILDKNPQDYDPEIITELLKKFEDVFGEDVPVCFETKEHYMKRWAGAEYRKNPFPFDPSRSYNTDRGETVRSKNELLCVNFVHSCGLNYRADAELLMKCGKTRYPDIIILNPKNLREEYHEIMGMMSNQGYVDDNILKIREYEESGYRLGERLHLYFESEKEPFDFEYFKAEIRRLYL